MLPQGTEPNAILEIESDSLGQWSAGLPTDLEDGLHTVVVTDETGSMQDIAFYSVNTKEQIQFIDRTKEVVADWFIYFVLFFLVVILVLAGNNLRLAFDKRKLKAKEEGKIKLYSVYLSLFSIFISLFVGGLMIYHLLSADQAVNTFATPGAKSLNVPKFNIDRLSGAVIDPANNELVNDVSISHNEVLISTKDGGNFTFSNIESGDLLEIKHESLTVPIYYQISKDKQYLDWYFNSDLYAVLRTILQAESDSNIAFIYDNLADEVKVKADKTAYIEKYDRLYLSNVDSVVILNIAQKVDWISKNEIQYPRVISFELSKMGKIKNYSFVYENLKWKLVE